MKHPIGEQVEVITRRHGVSQWGTIGVVIENNRFPGDTTYEFSHAVRFTREALGDKMLPLVNYYSYEDLHQPVMRQYDPTQVGDTDEDI